MNSPGGKDASPVAQDTKMATVPPRDDTAVHDDHSSGGNLEKIRDILVGAQLRDQDRRFAQLEQYMVRDSAALRQDLQRRLDSLESSMRKEMESLASRLTQEQETRQGSVTHLTHELNQLVSALTTKVQHLESQTTRAQHELQEQIKTRASELAASVTTHHAELTQRLTKAVEDLRADKTDRSTLSAILLEASQRLADDHSSSNHR